MVRLRALMLWQIEVAKKMARMTALGTIYKASPSQAKLLIQMCIDEEKTLSGAAKVLEVSLQTLKIYCAKEDIGIQLDTAPPVDTDAYMKAILAKYADTGDDTEAPADASKGKGKAPKGK